MAQDGYNKNSFHKSPQNQLFDRSPIFYSKRNIPVSTTYFKQNCFRAAKCLRHLDLLLTFTKVKVYCTGLVGAQFYESGIVVHIKENPAGLLPK